VIVRRQLERRDQGDVGGGPARLWRETRRIDQPLVDLGGPPQGGERPDLGREHGEVRGVAPPSFARLPQLAAVITHQVVAEGEVEPIDRPAAEQAAIGPEGGKAAIISRGRLSASAHCATSHSTSEFGAMAAISRAVSSAR